MAKRHVKLPDIDLKEPGREVTDKWRQLRELIERASVGDFEGFGEFDKSETTVDTNPELLCYGLLETVATVLADYICCNKHFKEELPKLMTFLEARANEWWNIERFERYDYQQEVIKPARLSKNASPLAITAAGLAHSILETCEKRAEAWRKYKKFQPELTKQIITLLEKAGGPPCSITVYGPPSPEIPISCWESCFIDTGQVRVNLELQELELDINAQLKPKLNRKPKKKS